MTDRLRQVKERIETVRQLESVITAMRGIAAAHLREVRVRLEGVRVYAETIAGAIGEALAFLPEGLSEDALHDSEAAELVIVLCAEQGFAGTFSERVLNVVLRRGTDRARCRFVMVGNRGHIIARERGVPIAAAFHMATHVDAVQGLAIKLADSIYAMVGSCDFNRVTLIHTERNDASELSVTERSLLPFDYARFPVPDRAVSPVLTLEPARLLRHLAEEYVFAELCEVLMLSHAAENEARVRAMVRARSNVVNTRGDLRTEFQQLRQDQITVEVAELATGRIAELRSLSEDSNH